MNGSLSHGLTTLVASSDGGASQGTFWLPPATAAGAAEIDIVFYYIYWLCVIFFIGIVWAMVHFCWKYRRTSPDQRTHPIKGSHKIEIIWSVIPGILLMSMFFWGFYGFIKASIPPADALEIRGTASQWRWSFNYPSTGCPSDELVVPVDTPIRMRLSSTDVIHSFGIPNFRVKRDILPERYTVVWFEATEIGEYDLMCTEYCGTRHSTMQSRVRVVSEEEYDDFLSSFCGLADLSPLEFGDALFNRMKPCSNCHATTPEGGPSDGPSLYGLYGAEETLDDGSTVLVDDNYIRNSNYP